MRREWLIVLAIAGAAFAIRVVPAWNAVFAHDGIAFLETDAWYHVRLVENQVRHFPWRVTLDPYAAPGGQFVPIAPLFDTLTAAVVVALHGRDATTTEVQQIAVFVPPLLGAVTIVFVWLLTRHVFDRTAGLSAAALLAVLPGHFLDRTMLGFVDHHALEACLATALLLACVWTLASARSPSEGVGSDHTVRAIAAGIVLGLYLLSWGSGAFLVAIVIVWIAVTPFIARQKAEAVAVARLGLVAAAVAGTLVWLFQDPRMHRYDSQLVALAGLSTVAILCWGSARAAGPFGLRATSTVVFAVGAAVSLGGLWLIAGDMVGPVLIDLGRLRPDPARMGVLEARPLFLYSGEWQWSQPWTFFRTGFYIGGLALVSLTVRIWRHRRAVDLLIWVFSAALFVATIGQNRFGYYLMPACAVLGGYLASLALNGTREKPRWLRDAAIMIVAGGMFGPLLAPSLLLAPRTSSFPTYWRDAMAWLRLNTPEPFAAQGGDGYYLAHYDTLSTPLPAFTVMNWWDQGYWVVQAARRVPVSNPTQVRAPNAARFYVETDESRAAAMLDADNSRYVIADWELPYRRAADGSIMGRFQSVLDWAEGVHAQYYEIVYRNEGGQWVPVWVFHDAYYRSMAFRLVALGGLQGVPATSTTVIRVADRVDASGARFRELVDARTYPTHDQAVAALETLGPAAAIVGLDPWTPAVPVPALTSLVEVYSSRAHGVAVGDAPHVRIFERR